MSEHSPAILAQLKRNDFAIEIMHGCEHQPWGLYTHPDGSTVRLPCDGRTRQHLKEKGFIFLGKEEK